MRKSLVGLFTLVLMIFSVASVSAAVGTSLDPSEVDLTMRVGETATVDKVASIPASPPVKVDLYFLVDTTGSFYGSLPVFKSAAPSIVNNLVSSGLDVHIGVGDFRDYPISPFGFNGDYAYRRHLDLSPPGQDANSNTIPDIEEAINGLSIGSGLTPPSRSCRPSTRQPPALVRI